jgi:hypothetical protein
LSVREAILRQPCRRRSPSIPREARTHGNAFLGAPRWDALMAMSRHQKRLPAQTRRTSIYIKAIFAKEDAGLRQGPLVTPCDIMSEQCSASQGFEVRTKLRMKRKLYTRPNSETCILCSDIYQFASVRECALRGLGP